VDLQPFRLDSSFSGDNNRHLESFLEFRDKFLVTALRESFEGGEWNDDDGAFACLSLDWKLEVTDLSYFDVFEEGSVLC